MATNDFKPFATGSGANVTSQTEWEALSALSTGFQSGKAASAQVNKAIRQALFIASALAQYTADKSEQDVLDDGDVDGFVAKMQAALGADFQPLNATLTALAALTSGANKLPYFTGSNAAALTSFTSTGRDIVAQANVTTLLAYCGLTGGLGTGIVGRLVNVQIITSSQTYTPSSVAKYGIVEVQGAGGAGGGAPTTSTSTSSGGGGGAGAYAKAFISSLTSVSVTIGSGGAGVSGSAGSAGGSTSFGSLITAGGGNGGGIASSTGANMAAGGTGASSITTSLTKYITSPGISGGFSNVLGISLPALSGMGGGSKFGGGGESLGSATTGRASPSYGAGGGGACLSTTGSALAGGKGGDGVVIVWEYA